MPSSLRSKVACFACVVIQDMSVTKVCFCREDIFASSPGEKNYFVWDVKVPNLSLETIQSRVVRDFRSRVSLVHGD